MIKVFYKFKTEINALFTEPYKRSPEIVEQEKILISTHHQRMVEARKNLNPMFNKNPLEDLERKTDFSELLGYRNGQFDFYVAFSSEYRGICELYSMVMLKLLFIFFCLISLAFFIIARVVFVYLTQWDKFKEILIEERRIASFSELCDRSISEYHLAVASTAMNYMKNSEYIIVGSKPLWNVVNGLNVSEWPEGLASVSLKARGFFLKGASSMIPNSFWVYYSKLEFIWTFVPCLILLFISVPSFTLALSLDESHKPVSWIKVLANQWFWVYETSTFGQDIVIYSNIVYGSDLTDNALRAIEADAVVTLVNNKYNRVLVTSADVIHCWAVPSLGIKIDACPGRINTLSIMPTKCGVYYGQCSEICGVNHGFMPIVVEVVV